MNPSAQTLCERCTIQQAGSAEGCPWSWPIGPAHWTVAPVTHSLDSLGISKSMRSDLIKTPSGSRAVQIQVRPHKSLKLDCLGRQQCHDQMEVLLNLWKPYRDIFKTQYEVLRGLSLRSHAEIARAVWGFDGLLSLAYPAYVFEIVLASVQFFNWYQTSDLAGKPTMQRTSKRTLTTVILKSRFWFLIEMGTLYISYVYSCLSSNVVDTFDC